MANVEFRNPYRPGAGHTPPYLAGREAEIADFARLLRQDIVLENVVLTGLRGVGKTVLMERYKERAIADGWSWVGADLSESASISEQSLAMRLLADLSLATSSLRIDTEAPAPFGFVGPTTPKSGNTALTHSTLVEVFDSAPGLVSDKIKAVLELVSERALAQNGSARFVFAYDEAQNLADHADREQFPLSVLLDVFQSIQRKNVTFLLLLVGLPTLFPKLVDARTYAERMFHVITLSRLDDAESREAVSRPISEAGSPVSFSDESVATICAQSAGYPYFIQFICREVFDVFISQLETEGRAYSVPVDAIQAKLDTDFFAGRWARATDRQRQLLSVIAALGKDEGEFTIQEVVEQSKVELEKPFSSSHANQMLVSLGAQGLVYKNRFGRYSFAVPLMGQFIVRTYRG